MSRPTVKDLLALAVAADATPDAATEGPLWQAAREKLNNAYDRASLPTQILYCARV